MLREELTSVGESVTGVVRWLGGMIVMLGRALSRGPRLPLGFFDISYQIFQLGIRSLPLATMMSQCIISSQPPPRT